MRLTRLGLILLVVATSGARIASGRPQSTPAPAPKAPVVTPATPKQAPKPAAAAAKGKPGPAKAATGAAATAPAAPVPVLQPSPELLSRRWTAHWIRPDDAPPKAFGVYHLRKAFDLAAVPPRFVVNVTADNRYELFVNGTRVATGPARGDLDHWRFETVDLAPQLKAGDNVLAAVIWNFAGDAPMAQVTSRPASCSRATRRPKPSSTATRRGRGTREHRVTLVPIDRAAIFNEYYVGSTGEQVDAASYPVGLADAGVRRQRLGRGGRDHDRGPRAIRDSPARWFLVPQDHSADGRHRRSGSLESPRTEATAPPDAFLAGSSPWTIPAHTTAHALLDRGYLTTAYPEVVTTGGKGAS